MTHVLYEPKDFTNEETETSSLAKMVVLGGLGICKVCGAGESQLDDFPTCEDYEQHILADGKVALIGKCHATTDTVIRWSVTTYDRDAVWLKRDQIEWIEATPLTDEVVVLDRDLAIQKGLIDA